MKKVIKSSRCSTRKEEQERQGKEEATPEKRSTNLGERGGNQDTTRCNNRLAHKIKRRTKRIRGRKQQKGIKMHAYKGKVLLLLCDMCEVALEGLVS
jgi:hypothetical protein